MGDGFADIAFTSSVQAVQEAMGSRGHYAGTKGETGHSVELGAQEVEFIARRDSFYMASVSETDWPYVQHRGGPAGFLKVLSATTLGFADYRGNRQYVSVGNVVKNDRVAIILVDYPQRARLKILGHARIVSADDAATLNVLKTPDYRARIERGFLITVAAYDWNCPQHITPRFTAAEVEAASAPMRARLAALEADLRACRERSRAEP
jgi:predicted pyridoxine 5'-phosphate oxidase superfamily flavin-nucleotide-binding protein